MGHKIVIIGSGIIGLYTGYILAQQNKTKDITYIAEFLPGDQSSKYTSPWAGGNFSTVSGESEAELLYDKLSFTNLQKLAEKFGPKIGLAKMPATEYYVDEHEIPSEKKLKSMATYIPDFEIIPKKELPEEYIFGLRFTTFNFFCPHFIAFLKNYLEARGATFIRRRLDHVDQAFNLFGDEKDPETATQVVFNCTGIGARHLGGVADENVYPTRGQVVVIRAPHIKENRAAVSKHWETYIIPRPYSPGGQVILGGYMQKDSWDGTATYGYESASILERTLKLFPEIDDHGRIPVDILRECSGLRPSRKGGARIEKEPRPDGKVIIHNYGAGGTGYQSGYGMALAAIKLLSEGSSKL